MHKRVQLRGVRDIDINKLKTKEIKPNIPDIQITASERFYG